MNSYQHAKNQAISLICSADIVDLKILLSDWLLVFWPIFLAQDFFKYGLCAGTQQL